MNSAQKINTTFRSLIEVSPKELGKQKEIS